MAINVFAGARRLALVAGAFGAVGVLTLAAADAVNVYPTVMWDNTGRRLVPVEVCPADTPDSQWIGDAYACLPPTLLGEEELRSALRRDAKQALDLYGAPSVPLAKRAAAFARTAWMAPAFIVTLWLTCALIGWVTRGFLGIPNGRDQRG
jgi:hypothetical protein